MSEHEKMKAEESNLAEVNIGGHDGISKHARIELEDNDLAEVTGGGNTPITRIPKPNYIVFQCQTCGSIKNIDANTYYIADKYNHSGPAAGGVCCGSYRKIKYHCPQCGSEYVYSNGHTIFCSACQTATGSDGHITSY
ncbi:hypothetical protein [Acetobacterium woodii]|uniref:hypothetical protein n=1 Tax=Acetobacterium woodii TaxID=33952 RepID=UPI0005A0DCA2|nr:hypothetical protein [Acetobacterium woodii]